MGWGDNLANLTAQDLQRREQARQFDLTNYLEREQLVLQQQAARRLAQKQAADQAERELANFNQLESFLPDAAAHEQAMIRALIDNDPEAALRNPQFAQLREQMAAKYGPAYRDFQALQMLNQQKLAQARHPGKDYASEAALKEYDARVKAFYEAKKAGVKMDFPASPVPKVVNGQIEGIYDPTELWQLRAQRAEEALGGFASGGTPPNPFRPNQDVTQPAPPQVPGSSPVVPPRKLQPVRRPITPAPAPVVPAPGAGPTPPPAPAKPKKFKLVVRSPQGQEQSIDVSEWAKFPGWKAVGTEEQE